MKRAISFCTSFAELASNETVRKSVARASRPSGFTNLGSTPRLRRNHLRSADGTDYQRPEFVCGIIANNHRPTPICVHVVPNDPETRRHADAARSPNVPVPISIGRARPIRPASRRTLHREQRSPLRFAVAAEFHLAAASPAQPPLVEAVQQLPWTVMPVLVAAHRPLAAPHNPPTMRRPSPIPLKQLFSYVNN